MSVFKEAAVAQGMGKRACMWVVWVWPSTSGPCTGKKKKRLHGHKWVNTRIMINAPGKLKYWKKRDGFQFHMMTIDTLGEYLLLPLIYLLPLISGSKIFIVIFPVSVSTDVMALMYHSGCWEDVKSIYLWPCQSYIAKVSGLSGTESEVSHHVILMPW